MTSSTSSTTFNKYPANLYANPDDLTVRSSVRTGKPLKIIAEKDEISRSLSKEQLIERMNFDNGMSDKDVDGAWIVSDSEDDLTEKKPKLSKRKIKVRRPPASMKTRKNLFKKEQSPERLQFEEKDDFKEIKEQDKVPTDD